MNILNYCKFFRLFSSVQCSGKLTLFSLHCLALHNYLSINNIHIDSTQCVQSVVLCFKCSFRSLPRTLVYTSYKHILHCWHDQCSIVYFVVYNQWFVNNDLFVFNIMDYVYVLSCRFACGFNFLLWAAMSNIIFYDCGY